jgi:serine/threonine-protein kinase
MEQVSSGKIGHYEILKVLGRGGMGEVLLAQDEVLGRRVAIKRPFKSALAEGLARFQVEAKAATLRHPNIPAVYELGTHDDMPFIAMEYVEGESLERIIDTKRELDLMTKLRIIEQVCSALGYAHENGIIHRDIKPANIIVQPDGTAKIIDFGIAKLQDDVNSGLTKASQLIGSLHYIAPERFWGNNIDGRVDIFSAGVTLFKLLTGTEPFIGGEATASFKIMNEAHAPLSAYLHDYPKVLDEIVEKSLAKNPEDRYQTGEDFADALHEVVEDLKHTRVSELFGDAERLTTERRFAPALELLDEAIKLDPSNTQARKLRKFVREHQDRARRQERLRECLLKSDEALISGNYEEALSQLKDAQNLDPGSGEITAKIKLVDEQKRRYERSVKALGDAEITKSRGDVNGAMRILVKALEEDPENKKLIAARVALARELELEAQRAKLLELLEQAGRAMAVRDLDTAEKLLNQAAEIDPTQVETEKLRRELYKAREVEQRRSALAEIEAKVHEFIEVQAFDKASDLLNRALERLPNDAMLLRLRAELDAESRRYETRRLVDAAIARANELFTSSPVEALSVLQKALEQAPGEERLVAYERTLKQELEAHLSEQLRENTVLKARELLEARNYQQAIDVLETYQLEFGQQAEIDALLTLVRGEFATAQRTETVSRVMAEARGLVRDGRFDEAAKLLESGVQQTKDAGLSTLLEEVRQQQAAQARKREAVEKRIAALRERGDLAEAIRLTEEQLSATPGDTTLKQLSSELRAEFEQQQATARAVQTANEAAQKKDFPAAIDALQAVVHAYGETPELTRALEDVKNRRSECAKDVVGQSIEGARGALLKSDPQGALDALKSATPHLEFADAAKQADWQRIAQSVKKALEDAGATSTHSAFDSTLAEVAATRPKRFPMWMVAAGAVVLVAIVVVVMFVLRPAPAPPTQTQIEIPKVPAGAKVQIDGVEQKVNASGSVVAVVTPEQNHTITITRDGFDPFTDTVQVEKGQVLREPFNLSPTAPAGMATGTFSVRPQSDLTYIRVFVDGEPKGQKRAGEKITLAVGTHRVRYAWPGYQDSKEHTIEITKNGEVADPVVLDKAAVVPAVQTQHTTPVVQQPPTQTQAQATPAAPAPAPAQATGSLHANVSSIERGQQVVLQWNVQNASQAEIRPADQVGQVAPSGSRPVSPSSTTTYQLVANGNVLAEATVSVTEPPKPVAAAPAPAPVVQKPAAPEMPSKDALVKGLQPYLAVFGRASTGKKADCKAAFSGVFGGRLNGFVQWCDTAKTFTVTERCGAPDGTADAPMITCTESMVVKTSEGTPDIPSKQKTFHFSKGGDGSWQVTSW